MTLVETCEVLVVGGGPAGSVSALLLARSGWRVTLVDRMRFPRDKPCGEYMSPGVGDTFAALGLPMGDQGSVPRSVLGMRIVGPTGTTMTVEYERDGAAVHALTMRRRDLDSALLARAAAEGVDVRESVMVRTPLVEDGRVVGVRATRGTDDLRIRARLTLAADGSRSTIARSLGLARPARWPVRLGLVAHYREGEHLTHGEMHVGRGGYCGVAPLPDGRLNVAMVLRADAIRSAGRSVTDVYDDWINDHPALARLLRGADRETTIRGIGPIGSRSVRAWYPGLLLVGDAAAFFDPFTGEGIFRAINGARLAAQVAHTALTTGEVGPEALARYDTLRAREFRDKQAVTALVQVFVQFPTLLGYALPRLAARDVPFKALAGALGDIAEPRAFLSPRVLWQALHP